MYLYLNIFIINYNICETDTKLLCNNILFNSSKSIYLIKQFQYLYNKGGRCILPDYLYSQKVFITIENDNVELYEWFINEGFDINLTIQYNTWSYDFYSNEYSQSPLIISIITNKKNILKYLLNKGEDINMIIKYPVYDLDENLQYFISGYEYKRPLDIAEEIQMLDIFRLHYGKEDYDYNDLINLIISNGGKRFNEF